jgi:hypothetical protein
MKWLEGLLADNPWPMIWALAVVALILVIAAVATGRAKYLFGVALLGLLASMLVIVEWVWETDGERVDKVIDALAEAVRSENAAEIEPHLSPQCRYGLANRDQIVQLADSVFGRIEIDRLTISSRKTEVFPLRNEATTEFLAVVRGTESNVEFNPYPTRWILTLRPNRSGQWQVVDIQQVPAFGENRQPINSQGIGLP